MTNRPCYTSKTLTGLYKPLLVLVFALSFVFSLAAAEIRVKESLDKPVLVAVMPFQGERLATKGRTIDEFIIDDFKISGLIMPYDTSKLDKAETNWLQRGIEYVITGEVKKKGEKYTLRLQLVDVILKKRMGSFKVSFTKKEYVHAANQAANLLFQKITGTKGAFNSRIAYIMLNQIGSPIYRIVFSYLNGADRHEIFRSNMPVLSLAFSPDGKKLAYVSYEKNSTPAIYIQDFQTGKRQRLQLFRTNTFAPSFSPDGKRLVFSASRNGKTDLYQLTFANGKIGRLTTTRTRYGINTEPNFSPDGSAVVFSSDRHDVAAGNPSIYTMNLSDKKVSHLTTIKGYSSAGSYIDSDTFLFIHQGEDKVYSLYRYYRNTGRYEQLTFGADVESYSMAPSRQYIIYTQTGALGGSSMVRIMHLRTLRGLLIAENRPGTLLREAVWSPTTE